MILGGILGWLTGIAAKRSGQVEYLTQISVGIIGAALGGGLFSVFAGTGLAGLSLAGLLVALAGAVISLAVVNYFFVISS